MSFGLRSALKIFSAIGRGDALEWVLTKYGVTFILHYLDDYLTIGRTGIKRVPTESRDNSESLPSLRGAMLKLEKIEGPTTSLVFLGILINTTKWNCVSLKVEHSHTREFFRGLNAL